MFYYLLHKYEDNIFILLLHSYIIILNYILLQILNNNISNV